MEWAREIVVNAGKLWADVASEDGATSLLRLEELYRRGLPAMSRVVRKRMTVNLQDFALCDARRYTAHFGISADDGATGGHQVFEVQHNGVTYLVPALALMRALFKPSPKLLHEMFGPSALERTLWLEYSGETADIVVDAKWAVASIDRQYGNWKGLLRWMISHPTARRMADSVHRHAMEGRLALDLANCEVEIVLSGIHAPGALLVTGIRILSVTPTEAPDVSLANWEPQIEPINRSWAVGKKPCEPVAISIPTHPDGTSNLTDEEWSVIGPLLGKSRARQQPFQLCRRSLFNSVLRKLSTGVPWRKCVYDSGDWRNAATAYRNWKTRGVFEQVLTFLRETR